MPTKKLDIYARKTSINFCKIKTFITKDQFDPFAFRWEKSTTSTPKMAFWGKRKTHYWKRGWIGGTWVPRPSAPRRGSRSSVVRRISRLERGVTGKERKVHDIQINGNVTNSAVFHHLTGIAQGDQSVQREGLKINLVSIQARISCQSNPVQQGYQPVRFILFIDRNCNGANPAITEVLESNQYNSLTAHEWRNRFHILMDKTIATNNQTENDSRGICFKYYKRFPRGRKVFYKGTAAPIANAASNQLFLLLIGDNATNYPIIDTEWRITFTD